MAEVVRFEWKGLLKMLKAPDIIRIIIGSDQEEGDYYGNPAIRECSN